MRRPTADISLGLALMALSAFLPGCGSMDEWTLFGYSPRSQFTRDIATIRVPIFGNRTFVRDVEFQLTEAVIKQIEAKTPWKVVQDGHADAELLGTVVIVRKRVIIHNPLNEVREADVALAVELVWRDLRTGEILSAPGPRLAGEPLPGMAADPQGNPLPPPPRVIVQRTTSFIPELGQSTASARKEVVDDLAEQIVSMMEVAW